MIKYNKDDGVWRTIGGRRVFIKNGQSLSDAMKESGKFKKKEKLTDSDEDKEIKGRMKELQREIDSGRNNKEKTERLKDELQQYKDKYEDYDKDAEFNRLAEASDKIDKTDRKKALTEKYLPKETEIKTQGKSNRKEVSENIQAHILDHYDNPVDFVEQMDAMDYLPTRWQAGQKLAEGGSYLIYNGDMADFLNSLKINPKGKTFSDTDAFNMYTSLIGRESANLYDRLQKMFNDYRSQHGGSDLTLDDFRKWFE